MIGSSIVIVGGTGGLISWMMAPVVVGAGWPCDDEKAVVPVRVFLTSSGSISYVLMIGVIILSARTGLPRSKENFP